MVFPKRKFSPTKKTKTFRSTKKHPGVKRTRLLNFRELKNSFDAATVAQSLVSDNRGAFGEKIVGFAGFRAWVVAPDDSLLIRDSMTIKMVEKYRLIIKGHRSDEKLSAHVREASALKDQKFVSFFKYVRTPLGSSQGGMRAQSLADSKRTIAERAASLTILLKFADVLNFASQLEPKTKYRDPSLNRLKDELLKLDMMHDGGKLPVGLSGRAIVEKWSKNRESISFMYAASTIKISDNNLLHLIGARKLEFKKAKAHLREWFARANYFTDNALKGIKDNSNRKVPFPRVDGIEAIAFKPICAFSANDEAVIRNALRK